MKYFIAAALAASLLGGSAAVAGPYDHHNNNGWNNGWNNGGHPHWSRGDRFRGYGNRGWVVNDYRSHHLRRPPRGYHWVEADNDYLLVAIASGVIADIVLNRR